MTETHNHSDDVRIRSYKDSDAEALFEAATESVQDVYPWLPWCHPNYTLRDAVDWIVFQRGLFEKGSEYFFAIVDSAGNFLGGCGLNHLNTVHRLANLGYWIRSSATGSGVAVSAVQQLRDWAFRETDLERLELLVDVENKRSLRVAEKSGAIREATLSSRLFVHGRAHDAVLHAFVREPRTLS